MMTYCVWNQLNCNLVRVFEILQLHVYLNLLILYILFKLHTLPSESNIESILPSVSIETEASVQKHVLKLGIFQASRNSRIKNHRRRLGLDHSSAISFFLPSCTSTASNRAKSTANSCPPPPCRLANPSCLEQCEAWLFIAFYAMQPHSPFTHAVHWNSSELFSWFCSELGLTVLRAMWRALIRERGAISCPV